MAITSLSHRSIHLLQKSITDKNFASLFFTTFVRKQILVDLFVLRIDVVYFRRQIAYFEPIGGRRTNRRMVGKITKENIKNTEENQTRTQQGRWYREVWNREVIERVIENQYLCLVRASWARQTISALLDWASCHRCSAHRQDQVLGNWKKWSRSANFNQTLRKN